MAVRTFREQPGPHQRFPRLKFRFVEFIVRIHADERVEYNHATVRFPTVLREKKKKKKKKKEREGN